MAGSPGSSTVFVKSSKQKKEMTINLIKKRADLADVYAMITKAGLDLSKWKDAIYRTQLTLQEALNASKPTVTFQTQKGNNNTDRPDEVRLDKNDVFVCFGINGVLQRVDLTNGATAGEYGEEPEWTYVDANYFDNSGEAAALETVFHGRLDIRVSNLKLIENINTAMFKRVPDSYYVDAGTPAQLWPAFNLEDAQYDLVKPLVLLGDQNYSIDWTRGTGTATAIAGASSAETNTVKVILDGFVIKNLAAQGYSAGLFNI